MRSRWSFFLVSLSLVTVLGVARPAHAKQRVAVLGVEPQDTGNAASQKKTAELAKALTDALRARSTFGNTGLELAPNSAKELSELKLLGDCIDEGDKCMSAIGKDLNADLLVYGHVEHSKAGYTVTVRSLVVGAAPKAGPITMTKKLAAADANDAGMKRLANDAFSGVVAAPEPPPEPMVMIEANVPTGTVYVNGQAKGQLTNGSLQIPAPPDGALVAIESQGYDRFETKVAGKQASVKATLNKHVEIAVHNPPPDTHPQPNPLIPPPKHEDTVERPGKTARILFWTSLIVTAGGATAFTITGLQVKSIEDEQRTAVAAWGNGYKSNGVQFPNDACAEAQNDGYQPVIDVCNRGKNMATLTNVFIGVTAVAAVSTAFFFWKGYLQPKNAGTEQAARRMKRTSPVANVLIAPEVYKGGGGGVGAVIQF